MKNKNKSKNNENGSVGIGALITIVILVLITSCMVGCPKYRVYSQTYRGEAALREAEWSKKVIIETAIAEEEAAKLKAEARVTLAKAEGQAEVVRAEATAEANEIIGDSLKNNEAYLRYLFIMGLHEGEGDRIYIPTEAGLPILEAGSLSSDNGNSVKGNSTDQADSEEE